MRYSSNISRIIKHILLVGDDPSHLLALQHHITRLNPDVKTLVTDICSVRDILRKQAPDVIFVNLTAGTGGHFPYIQAIRQEPLADRIPVFVCLELLNERTLKELLNREGWALR